MHGVVRETLWIPGATRLSGELAYPVGDLRAACLLVPPHPFMGGRMDNNVVTALATALPESDVATLRFDYTGVGASDGGPIDVTTALAAFWATGHAPSDPILIEDAARALDWLIAHVRAPTFVAGYSFGASAGAAVAQPGLSGLILISPTLSQHPIAAPPVPGVPTLVIYSGADFATDQNTTIAWLDRCGASVESLCVTGGTHFHVGRERELSERVRSFIDGVLAHEGVPAR